MADNDKDIPIKEKEDGSLIAKVDLPEEIDDDVEVPVNAEDKKENDNDDDDEDHDDDADEAGDAEAEADAFDDDEREKIREARREERRLKKDLKRQRELTAKNKILALERRNEDLAKRLAEMESVTTSFKFAQLDKSIEDENARVEYAKYKMIEAAQANNMAAQVEYLEQLTEAKERLKQAEHFKKQQLEVAKTPKQSVPSPTTEAVQRNASEWLKRSSWYDPQTRDTDSRIAKVVDQELAGEGWDPADPEYWDELDNRLKARLPHRYAAKGNMNTRRNAGPTSSSRTANVTGQKAGTITLSRERVNAIKDAGAWDDVEKRNKMIRAYAMYDRQNKGQ